MPFVSNRGVDVFYRMQPSTKESDSSGTVPLFLAHGFMQHSEDWAVAGYVNRLAERRLLILPDFRGHGKSGKPHTVADYGMDLLVEDVLLVLDALDVPRVDFLGYSFGAWVGFGMASFAPSRLRSLILGGMHPYVRDPGPLDRRIERFTRTRDALAAGGHHADLIPEQVKSQFAENDVEALICLTTAIRDSAGFEESMGSLDIPGLIYAGEEDPAYPLAQQCVQGLPNWEFLPLPGLGHMEAWNECDLVLPHITDFLQKVDQVRAN